MSDIKVTGVRGRERGSDRGRDRDCGCHVDHVTLGGRGTKHHPFKAIGLPNAQPFANTTTTIFVRPGGKDEKDRGSANKPFATLQFALTQVPNILAPGETLVFDVTGVTETFPPDYEFPVILTTTAGGFTGAQSPTPYYQAYNGVIVTATPQLASLLSPADAVISAADAAVISSDPVTNLVTITIATPRAAWAGNALKGKQLIRTVKSPNSINATCAIYGSSANQLLICNDAGSVNGGNGPLVLAAGEVLQIVEPSATFIGSTPTVNAAAISCWGINAVSFQGIHFVIPPNALHALALGNTDVLNVELCVVEGLLAINIPNGFALLGNVQSLTYDLEPVPGLPTRTLFTNFNQPFSYFYIAAILQTFIDTVFDNTCPTLTEGVFFVQVPSNWGFQNVLFQGSTGDAISAHTGQWNLVNVSINNSAGNGITISDDAFAKLTTVSGSGNAGFGVQASNGTRCLADPTTNVTGASGDTQSGSLAVTTWAQVAAGLAFDIPPNSAIAVATGTRIGPQT